MEWKFCNECKVTCWHNPTAVKDRASRCVHCGSPAGGNTGTPKRELAQQTIREQTARARLLNIRTIGRPPQ